MRKTGTVSKVVALSLSAMVFTVAAQALPVEEVKASTEAGVEWLAGQQSINGQFGSLEVCAVTAFAVKKLMHHAVDPVYGQGLDSPFDPAYPYVENIESGLDYILTNCTTKVDIDNVPVGVDTDGNGKAIVFDGGHHEIYATGISLMTICETGALDRIVQNGPLAGMTYGEVAQNTMDYLLWGQNDSDSGWAEGGWGYSANTGRSDNSISGYATLGLTYAVTAPPEGCGFNGLIPEVTKTQMNTWIDYIQNDTSGGSGYSSPISWVNVLKTGNLLQQMAFVGDGPEAPRVLNALGYLENTWNSATQDPGWLGDGVSNYQATYTLMKGLKGLNIQTFGTPPIDWKNDFEVALLDQQLANGSWPQTQWDSSEAIMSTSWALMTLQQAAPVLSMTVELDVHPTSCPNPLNKKSKGVTPMAILGTADFDVRDVNVSSLEINGVSPVRSALEDVATPYEGGLSDPLSRDDCSESGADGFEDLTLKFKTQALLDGVAKGVQMMEITGETLDGTPFTGQDVVWVK